MRERGLLWEEGVAGEEELFRKDQGVADYEATTAPLLRLKKATSPLRIKNKILCDFSIGQLGNRCGGVEVISKCVGGKSA